LAVGIPLVRTQTELVAALQGYIKKMPVVGHFFIVSTCSIYNYHVMLEFMLPSLHSYPRISFPLPAAGLCKSPLSHGFGCSKYSFIH
jgi:hypothetical protein